MKFRHIAIEGPIGVGKTTLAQQLCRHYKAHFLGDTEEQNPYLKGFYANPQALALHTQLHFLVSRLRCIEDCVAQLPQGQILVADFLIDKDLLFAELTLDETEWWMYEQLYHRLSEKLPRPDLVIYLQAPLERLIERIERRGRSHEQRIDSNYLQALSGLYERHFHQSEGATQLVVNTAEINLADSSQDIERLLVLNFCASQWLIALDKSEMALRVCQIR